ncbi:ABC transporter permease [Enterovirga aerilata]|uniref:ABC transporter permease subunit n=1 Tax=Enterovirga aerilata TaxID=2730920 RepID=A0A849IA09_9HYPH|nr:ABC transporter permease subunit [Enterovirga sp. DB1703]NNM73105.1 ABC transporter permease subunit [Enterovirga sp. DB1703]
MRAAADVDVPVPASPPAVRRAGRLGDSALVLLGLLALWQFGSWVVGAAVLPAPAATLAKLWAIMSSSDFGGHAWETGRAFLSALAIAFAAGLAIGLLLGAHRLSAEVAEPILVALYAIPKITLYPIILLLFGLGISAKIAFGVIHGIVPVAVFTMAAVRNIRPVYLRAARAMRLTPVQTAGRIMLPAALPGIVSGLRIGFSLTLLGTLIGEMFASQRGIGYLLVKAMETNDVATVVALATLLIVVATIVSGALLALNRRLDRSPKPGR